MMTRLSLFCFAAAIFAFATNAEAQIGTSFGDSYGGGYGGAYGGGAVYEPGSFAPVASELNVGMPGRLWFEASVADRGLGYTGSYLTLGGKTRLFQDFLDGRWLGEVRLHHAVDGGGFFANVGIERVFSIKSAGADVSFGAWYDHDSDQQGAFAHSFNSVGLSAAIKTRRWDLIGNGYFPQGTTDYTQGDITGVNCFLGHNIVTQPGIDSALTGFDATFRMRPNQLAFANGTVDIGGYAYDSDSIEHFGGGRVALGFQMQRGLIVNAEVNYDDRFKTTGVLSMGWIFGGNARGNEYAGIGRDLDPTLRNDHIVRFQQDTILAIDPDTGRAYNVYHVDNTADANFETGTAETAFTTLAAAEAASSEGDIIFVREGDGTARGMRNGITLKDDQLFLGDGVQHIIPIQDGLNFVLCNDVDGNRPTISGSNNGAAVTLADNNVVRGFNIDGTQGSGNMAYGIRGDGFTAGSPITNGIIEDNIISGAILHGVFVNDIAGDWDFKRNAINNNAFDGIFILDACDPTSVFTFEDNMVNANGRDGIHIENYDAQSLTFLRNQTNGNVRDGLRLVNFKNTSGNGLDLRFQNHVSNQNLGIGLHIVGGSGNLDIINSDFSNNPGGGLRIQDWTSDLSTNDRTLIQNSTFLNNTTGIGIDILQTVGPQRLTITESTSDGNLLGLVVTTDGTLSQVFSSIFDNISFSGNASDGMRFVARNGSFQDVVIDQPNRFQLLSVDNNGGNGISFQVGSEAIGLTSFATASINRTQTNGNGGSGVFVDSRQDGNIELGITNSVSSFNGNGFSFFVDSFDNQNIDTFFVQNITAIDNVGNGLTMVVNGTSLADLVVLDSLFQTTVPGAPTGLGNGIQVVANGPGTPLDLDDSRVRVVLEGNTITQFALNGIDLTLAEDAEMLARVAGNTLQGNGPGIDPTMPPFFDTIDINTFDTSRLDLLLLNNEVTSPFGPAVTMTTNGTSRINSVWVNNEFIGVPVSGVVNNAAGSEICLAMSTNFFATGFNVGNAGGLLDFTLELDGVTNGFGQGDVGANFDFQPFGTVCRGLIDAQDAVFQATGFPPLP